eukprot:4330758-Pleurochrysis_carterae.AAC.2
MFEMGVNSWRGGGRTSMSEETVRGSAGTHVARQMKARSCRRSLYNANEHKEYAAQNTSSPHRGRAKKTHHKKHGHEALGRSQQEKHDDQGVGVSARAHRA